MISDCKINEVAEGLSEYYGGYETGKTMLDSTGLEFAPCMGRGRGYCNSAEELVVDTARVSGKGSGGSGRTVDFGQTYTGNINVASHSKGAGQPAWYRRARIELELEMGRRVRNMLQRMLDTG